MWLYTFYLKNVIFYIGLLCMNLWLFKSYARNKKSILLIERARFLPPNTGNLIRNCVRTKCVHGIVYYKLLVLLFIILLNLFIHTRECDPNTQVDVSPVHHIMMCYHPLVINLNQDSGLTGSKIQIINLDWILLEHERITDTNYSFYSLVKPQDPITSFIPELTSITNEMAKDNLPFPDVMNDFLCF